MCWPAETRSRWHCNRLTRGQCRWKAKTTTRALFIHLIQLWSIWGFWFSSESLKWDDHYSAFCSLLAIVGIFFPCLLQAAAPLFDISIRTCHVGWPVSQLRSELKTQSCFTWNIAYQIILLQKLSDNAWIHYLTRQHIMHIVHVQFAGFVLRMYQLSFSLIFSLHRSHF